MLQMLVHHPLLCLLALAIITTASGATENIAWASRRRHLPDL